MCDYILIYKYKLILFKRKENEPLRYDWKSSLGSQSHADSPNIFSPLSVSPSQLVNHQGITLKILYFSLLNV